jgi:hypothetical protein
MRAITHHNGADVRAFEGSAKDRVKKIERVYEEFPGRGILTSSAGSSQARPVARA